VREITGGEGVAVVYDGVGKDTFMGSLDSLRVRGMMVSFGNASGPGAALRSAAAVAEGFAVHDAADP
jgi:NADPH2:quinone reductase